MASTTTAPPGLLQTPSPPESTDYSTSPSSSASDNGSLGPSAPHGTDFFLTKGLQDAERKKYRDPQSFFRALSSQADKILSGKASQFAVFAPVTQAQLAAIERIRHANYKGLRFQYFKDAETLIVKIVAGIVHGLASMGFGTMLDIKIGRMGLRYHIARTEATTFHGNGSQKEADCSWKPGFFRRLATDWPTMVIECGVEKSLERLKADVHWWFEHSEGQVKIVLVISFSQTKREIHFEQWEMATMPGPYLSSGEPGPARRVPLMVREFDIAESDGSQGSLAINFESIFLRPPVQGHPVQYASIEDAPIEDAPIQDASVEAWNLHGPPVIGAIIPEGDFTFGPVELSYYATHVWYNAQ